MYCGQTLPMNELIDLWPLFRLRLCQDRLELRLPVEADLGALAELAGGEIHDPKVMPFTTVWTDTSAAQRRRGTLQGGSGRQRRRRGTGNDPYFSD
jgi:hypothetical protein